MATYIVTTQHFPKLGLKFMQLICLFGLTPRLGNFCPIYDSFKREEKAVAGPLSAEHLSKATYLMSSAYSILIKIVQ
jgi:hypothetical protein